MEAIGLTRYRVLSPEGLQAVAVHSLGLDAELIDLQSPEAIAALVRRAASFSAPCSARVLRDAVLQALHGLPMAVGAASEELRATIVESIEALTSYGDLLELPTNDTDDSPTTRLLYLAPPTYVRIDETLFLLGGSPDGGEAVPYDLRANVEHRSHTRQIHPSNAVETAKHLRAIGWIELRSDLWLTAPNRVTPEKLHAEANSALAAKMTGGDVAGLTVLDSSAPVTYYKGRWTAPSRKSGRFVARREQRYGADLWCYVALSNGIVTHLVDLPLDMRTDVRGCDAAWHLQMAIDALAGRPQVYRLRTSPPPGSVLVDLFSPVPLWARRRWDVLGEEIPRSNSLFSYRFSTQVFADVEQTLRTILWVGLRS